jgi:hypothetical protein
VVETFLAVAKIGAKDLPSDGEENVRDDEDVHASIYVAQLAVLRRTTQRTGDAERGSSGRAMHTTGCEAHIANE